MSDWFCPSLLVPPLEALTIRDWVEDQDWPEGTKLKDPETYHVTLVYSRTPHTSKVAKTFMYELNMDNWEYGVRVTDIRKFTGHNGLVPVVIVVGGALFTMQARHYLARARALGLDPAEHGEYTPHITVAEVPDADFNVDALPLPGPDSALGFPLKFMFPQKATELHGFYQEKRGV